jgi:hypothetical protein
MGLRFSRAELLVAATVGAVFKQEHGLRVGQATLAVAALLDSTAMRSADHSCRLRASRR